jgi:hypothetical protein
MQRLAGFLILLLALPAQAEFRYRTPKQIGAELRDLAGKDSARLQVLAKTPGGRDVWLLSLGKEDSKLPAVLVVANMEGNSPLASAAALELSRRLLSEWKDDLKSRSWYILPVGNPDGYANFFKKPLFERYTNDRPFNDDRDDQIGEDGPEDLNKDGFITLMRQPHPEGEWMPVEKNPVLMKKADPGKGERGLYRVFTEGIDNDKDGQYNEDGPGGTNPGRNFPHNFAHYTKTDGPWAASEPASRAVLEFAYDRPEIGMLIVFGPANSLKKVPEGKKTEATQDKYKVPERIAKQAGLNPDEKYLLKDLVQMAREYTGYKELTEEMVLQFLGVGAASKPDQKDLAYWNEISKRYNEFIKKAGLDKPRLDPPGFPPGSIDEWGYYQYGVPTFSVDFWTPPVKKPADSGEFSPDKIEKMTKEEFIALGKEKIDALIKKSGAPAQFNAEMVIKGLESGMLTTKKIAEFIRQAKKKEESGGVDPAEQALYEFKKDAFVAWKPYRHPTLGKVEIGGKIPWAHLLPPKAKAQELLDKQLPFVRELSLMLARVKIAKVEVTPRGAGVWKLEAWVENRGYFPYPTHQGERCKRPPPVAVTLQDGLLLEGRKRQVLKLLPGSGGAGKAAWVLRGKPGSRVTVSAQGFAAGSDRKVVTLKGGGK